jgi:hypothetical protein
MFARRHGGPDMVLAREAGIAHPAESRTVS